VKQPASQAQQQASTSRAGGAAICKPGRQPGNQGLLCAAGVILSAGTALAANVSSNCFKECVKRLTETVAQPGIAAQFPSVGRWSVTGMPGGWIYIADFGIRQMKMDARSVAASVCVGQDTLQFRKRNSQYIEKQMKLIEGHLKEAKLAGPQPTAFPGADEANFSSSATRGFGRDHPACPDLRSIRSLAWHHHLDHAGRTAPRSASGLRCFCEGPAYPSTALYGAWELNRAR
jgi:hypothetical protein